MLFALLPWLDQSPVKSIRYKGLLFKSILAVWVVCFLILGYLGVLPPSPTGKIVSQICSILYLAFFAFMPWYTRMDKTLPVPERVTSE
jgi:ubiquinol-cytochrome c reductase cytochrome b subunit